MALTDIEAGRLADNVFNVVGANKNLIINGAMQVAQRGTSSTASDYGTVDRFFTSFSGGAVTTTQESLTSGDPYDAGFRNFVLYYLGYENNRSIPAKHLLEPRKKP